MNKIYENLNKPQPEFTLGIFLDLKKAFDCCNLDILLKKLEYYGFKNVANTWFQNYLVNRTQYVCINGIFSKEKTILCGVPQYRESMNNPHCKVLDCRAHLLYRE